MQQQTPLLRLWELGENYHSGLSRAILSAFIGVLGGMAPYFAAAQMIIGLSAKMMIYLSISNGVSSL